MALEPKARTAGSGGAQGVASLLGTIGQLASLFSEKETKSTTKTSGGKTVSGLDITQEGVDKLIQDILESNQGLASVTSGQKTSGLYNSTSNQLLVNDLLARASGEVAKATAKTVTTTSPQSSTTTQVAAPEADLLGTALVTGGGMLASKLLSSALTPSAKAVDTVSAALSPFSGGATSSGFAGAADFGIDDDFLTSFGGGTGGVSSGFGGFGVGDIAGVLTGDGRGVSNNLINSSIGNAILPGIGGAIGSLIPGTIDGLFNNIGGVVQKVFGGLGESVVCTELLRQGLMPIGLYLSDVNYARTFMSPAVLNGYRFWGVPLVRLMRKSKRLSKFVAWFAVNRAQYVAGQKNFAGKIINCVGVPLCYIISLFISEVDYSELYRKV